MKRSLGARIATGVVFLPVLFLLIQRGGWAFTGLLVLIVLLGAWEWWRLTGAARATLDLPLLAAGALGTFQGVIDPRPERLALALAFIALVVLLTGLACSPGNATDRSARLLLGILYVGLLPAFLVRMRALPIGRDALLLTYGVVFLCDTGAYGIGRWLGRHPLAPRISPRKTWEGALAGLVTAICAAWIGRAWFAHFLTPAGALGFGLIAGVLGQAGDLVESLWKREAGVKDSSALIPGHGGVLDRFDSLHFAAPALYAYLTVFI